MNQGDLATEKGDMVKALEEYDAAEQLLPENLEMKYWKAVGLANNKRIGEALPLFKDIFREDENWRELTKRLPRVGLLNVPDSDYRKIIDL